MGSIKLTFFKSLISTIFHYTGLSVISRNTIGRNGNYILMFHGVSNNKNSDIPVDIQPHLDVDEFEIILRWIKKRFQILNPNDLHKSEKKGVLFTTF